MQVDFLLQYLENISRVPYGFGWGCKGQIFSLEYNEADIPIFVIFIGNIAGDPFGGHFEIVGTLIFCTVKDKSRESCIFPF